MSIKTKIKEIYEAHKKSNLFNDSFENVIFKLTNAYDFCYLSPMLKMANAARRGLEYPNVGDEWEELNDYRHSYRACIKFVFEDCKHGSFDGHVSLEEIEKYKQEMRDTVYFNFIRNTIERYRLGQYAVEDKGDRLCFMHKKGDRSLIYDAYSRRFADEIPGGKNSKDDISVFDFQTMIFQLAAGKQEFQSKKLFKPANHVLREMVYSLVDHYLGDLSNEIGYLRATTYSLGEYLLVFCYLAAIGVYKIAYLLSLKGSNDLVLAPSIVYPKERLISDIAEVVYVKEDVVRMVINDMMYDYDFHKDRVTLYQPLFEIGDNILCSCAVLFHSYVIDKVMKYFDCKGTNKEDLTIYHRYMSDKMNHRMADNLPYMYSNLKTFENKTLTIRGRVMAEVDLIVFDTLTKTAALIELKNYTPVDNDADAIRKEQRINQAIESRIEKDKRVLDNLDLFFEQNNLSKAYMDYKFTSLLVTNSFAGGVGVKENIKVLDESLFYFLLRSCYGNLQAFIQYVDEGRFFKAMEETLTIADAHVNYVYKGITVEIINKKQ